VRQLGRARGLGSSTASKDATNEQVPAGVGAQQLDTSFSDTASLGLQSARSKRAGSGSEDTPTASQAAANRRASRLEGPCRSAAAWSVAVRASWKLVTRVKYCTRARYHTAQAVRKPGSGAAWRGEGPGVAREATLQGRAAPHLKRITLPAVWGPPLQQSLPPAGAPTDARPARLARRPPPGRASHPGACRSPPAPARPLPALRDMRTCSGPHRA
jgi:hypothetical protein